MKTWLLIGCLLTADGFSSAPAAPTNELAQTVAAERKAQTNQIAPLFAEGVPQPPPMNVFETAGPSHLLSAGDIVEIKVYQEEELNTRARIESDGSIAMPLLGLVRLSGKTVAQAQKFIHDALERDYLQKPLVAVTVNEQAKQRFSILGEVKQPGCYLMPENENVTLLQAISMAGGYTMFAQSGRITIKRVTGGKESVLQVNANAMVKTEDVSMMTVQANDTIVVNPKRF